MKAKPGTIGNTLAGLIKGLSTVFAVVSIAANAIAGVSSDSAPDVVKCRQWLAERWRENDANGNPAGERGEPFPIDMPLPWLEIDNYDWFERHNSRVELARTTNPQIVFIGDSITHAWEANDRRGDAKGVFNRWFGKYTTLNLGFGWDRIQNVLWRLEHGEMEGTNPKVVVIHIGTNNTAPGYKYNAAPNPPGEVADGILAVCRKVRELAPNARIVLMKVFPRGKTPADPYRGKVAAVNAELDRKLADFRDNKLTVLDMYDKFVDKDGNISLDLTIDYLHPTAKGYDLWAEALAPIIEAECVAPPSATAEANDMACRVVTNDTWHGFERRGFEFQGREAWIVKPKAEAAGCPWAWIMEWPEAFAKRTGSVVLLAAGFHVVTLRPGHYEDGKFVSKPGNMNDARLRESRAFQKYLVDELHFAPKANLIGMSWGGFYSVRYAGTYPDAVARIYLDAPLLDFSTLVGKEGEFWGLNAKYGIDVNTYVGKDDPRQPVNMYEPIAKAGIPILLLYGGSDATVPPSKNCLRFAQAFKAAGGNIEIVAREPYGHHPHGLEIDEQQKFVEFFNRK